MAHVFPFTKFLSRQKGFKPKWSGNASPPSLRVESVCRRTCSAARRNGDRGEMIRREFSQCSLCFCSYQGGA
jgi:hypothetical protein